MAEQVTVREEEGGGVLGWLAQVLAVRGFRTDTAIPDSPESRIQAYCTCACDAREPGPAG